ncbi:hypothetical protein DUNSADRAFT_5156 [Dunaliella salina]|uniref:Peptidase C1A papain C-terminal domain-containing protein n=1 Tax=Dunaliella salina TaxID=3046 RepID=A0ABQ7H7F0_DUNSA|nr:hypothetical protein DUNSADRAFT_5156 [Dunaliella salina]|eukprot:KAF5842784.1 hypothetical protein DUNSADRAFT_5156 [Dunaliella salina]
MVLHMVGTDLLSGSHFDQYELTFTHFKSLHEEPKNAFVPPKICRGHALAPALDTHHARRLQFLSLLPSSIVSVPSSSSGTSSGSSSSSRGSNSGHSIHAGSGMDAAQAAETWQQRIASALSSITGSSRSSSGVSGGSSSSSSSSSSSNRGSIEQARTKADLDFIHRWNAEVDLLRSRAQGSETAQPSFKLSPNKFLSLPEEQWQAVALGRRPEQAKLKAHKPLRNAARLEPFKRVLRDDQLPTSVDWRGTPADGPVKDQATCGSCWAFASAGAMTGAWFLATGSSMSLSEQQLVDCSWDSGEYGNYGCGGGWQESALTYAASAGIASESDYEYLGQNGYCRENKTEKVARFKGFMVVPYKDEKAMMEAVATHGPLAISYDAADITMKYYSEGVYYRENCGNTADDLDHAVTLVGYGTTPDGVNYWLLRNSWSVMWGESGYFKVARKGNDCGITVDGVVAVVDSKAAALAVSEDSARRIAAARAAAVQGAPAAGVTA